MTGNDSRWQEMTGDNWHVMTGNDKWQVITGEDRKVHFVGKLANIVPALKDSKNEDSTTDFPQPVP